MHHTSFKTYNKIEKTTGGIFIGKSYEFFENAVWINQVREEEEEEAEEEEEEERERDGKRKRLNMQTKMMFIYGLKAPPKKVTTGQLLFSRESQSTGCPMLATPPLQFSLDTGQAHEHGTTPLMSFSKKLEGLMCSKCTLCCTSLKLCHPHLTSTLAPAKPENFLCVTKPEP